MWSCNFCLRELAWSSWTRVRGHLGGDSILALANGATACMSASSDVKLMFKGILAAETEKKSRRSGHEARPRCRRKGRWRQQQQRQRLRVQATALSPERIRGERLLVFTSLILLHIPFDKRVGRADPFLAPTPRFFLIFFSLDFDWGRRRREDGQFLLREQRFVSDLQLSPLR